MKKGWGNAVVVSALIVSLAPIARADCSSDTDCKGDRICVDGACRAPADSATGDDRGKAHKVKRRFVRPTLFYSGIFVTALVPVSFLVAFAAAVEKQQCENDALALSFGGHLGPTNDGHCSNYDPTITTAVIAGVALAIAGTVMIVVGAKREPIEPKPEESRLKLVPWSDRNGGGAALRFQF